ncbi:MAG: hypothetical protein Q8M02_06215 [Candidatus Didemnitutus sp.]|nr:hypothetical protein [Candidatus Didemnitutus sp.]
MPKVSRANDVNASSKSGRSLWAWVAAAFLFLAVLWATLFYVAGQAKIETVPRPSAQPAKT